MDWFRSKEYTSFITMLDELGGFYFERVSRALRIFASLVDRSSGAMRLYIHLVLPFC